MFSTSVPTNAKVLTLQGGPKMRMAGQQCTRSDWDPKPHQTSSDQEQVCETIVVRWDSERISSSYPVPILKIRMLTVTSDPFTISSLMTRLLTTGPNKLGIEMKRFQVITYVAWDLLRMHEASGRQTGPGLLWKQYSSAKIL